MEDFWDVQGMELGLRTLAAGGSLMVGTLQGGKREQCRFEPERDHDGVLADEPAFDNYIAGIRKQGALLHTMLAHPWPGYP